MRDEILVDIVASISRVNSVRAVGDFDPVESPVVGVDMEHSTVRVWDTGIQSAWSADNQVKLCLDSNLTLT